MYAHTHKHINVHNAELRKTLIQKFSCFSLLLTQSFEANLLYFHLSKFLSFMQYSAHIFQTTVFHCQ